MNLDKSTLALERLYALAAEHPHVVCMTQPMGSGVIKEFTWSEVLQETSKIANHLLQLNLPNESKIAILSKNCAYWLIADWAIWMAGFISVPLYPTLSSISLKEILAHSEAALLFVGKLDNWQAIKDGIPTDMACIDMPLAATNEHINWDSITAFTQPLDIQITRGGDEICTIIYTSGTTGSPKGVMHSFNTFAFAVAQGLKRFPLTMKDRMLSYLPLSHIAERVLVEHVALSTGMHIFFAESLDTFLQDLHRARPTFFFTVPRLWLKFKENILKKVPERRLQLLLRIPIIRGVLKLKILKVLGLDQCKIVASGAAPMPHSLLHWYKSLGLQIAELYGMTENCGLSHSTSLEQFTPGTVGTPYTGVESRIEPSSSEIQMKSNSLMLGYYKDKQHTNEAFTNDGWMRTGDQGKLNPQGNLLLTGRLNDLFKTSKGKYVVPAPIEDQLIMITGVEACCVVGANLPGPMGLLMLSLETAHHCKQPEGRKKVEDLANLKLQEINSTLDAHERLTCLVLLTSAWTIESGFLTPTLKVKRGQIDAFYKDQYETWLSKGKAILWHH
jgi:long-chain acyl-CoA synthetase